MEGIGGGVPPVAKLPNPQPTQPNPIANLNINNNNNNNNNNDNSNNGNNLSQGVVGNSVGASVDAATAAAAAAAAVAAASGVAIANNDEGGNASDEPPDGDAPPGDANARRRFFPRVKHLLTPEWGHFLQGLLNALESTGAHYVAAASHKPSNAWYRSFHKVYAGVARECSVPMGKNRYHKFKDKIVELWVALENHRQRLLDNGIDQMTPLQDLAARQLGTHRKACQLKQEGKAEMVPPTIKGYVGGYDPNKRATPCAPPHYQPGAKRQQMMMEEENANNKMVQQIPSINIAPRANSLKMWAHLDEKSVIKKLPARMQQLVHVRHLGAEIQHPTPPSVEESYQQELEAYLNAATVSGKPADELFSICQTLILLWRFAQRLRKGQEARRIVATYQLVVHSYIATLESSCATYSVVGDGQTTSV